MKNLVLKKLLLLSKKEGKAREIPFHIETTVITGVNDTGKSSLIKSIFHSLGASVKFHSTWNAIDVITLLYFELDKAPIAYFDSADFSPSTIVTTTP